VPVKKQTFGQIQEGAAVDLSHPQKEGPVYYAEGPETGLSLFAALPKAQVKVTLGKGNFGKIDTTATSKDIVLCLDNDAQEGKDKIIAESAERLITAGKNVWIAKPETVKDYNDLIRKQGAEAIQANIDKAVPYANYRDQSPAPHTLKDHLANEKNGMDTAVLKGALMPIEDRINGIKMLDMHTDKQLALMQSIDANMDKIAIGIKNNSTIDLNQLNPTLDKTTAIERQIQRNVIKNYPDNSRAAPTKDREKEPEL
jgi:DNA primase